VPDLPSPAEAGFAEAGGRIRGCRRRTQQSVFDIPPPSLRTTFPLQGKIESRKHHSAAIAGESAAGVAGALGSVKRKRAPRPSRFSAEMVPPIWRTIS